MSAIKPPKYRKPPQCPLCLRDMVHGYEDIRKKYVFACHVCRIMIEQSDPLVDKWKDKKDPVPCPNCDSDMRVFFTSTGYMKAVCPKKKTCGCAVVRWEPDSTVERIKKEIVDARGIPLTAAEHKHIERTIAPPLKDVEAPTKAELENKKVGGNA